MNIDLAQKATRLVMFEAFEPQTYMVDELLSNGTFSYNDIRNFYDRGFQPNAAEEDKDFEVPRDTDSEQIISWVPIRGLLSVALISHGAPVLKNDHGTWWGRTSPDTTIFRDPLILEVTKSIYQKVGDER